MTLEAQSRRCSRRRQQLTGRWRPSRTVLQPCGASAALRSCFAPSSRRLLQPRMQMQVLQQRTQPRRRQHCCMLRTRLQPVESGAKELPILDPQQCLQLLSQWPACPAAELRIVLTLLSSYPGIQTSMCPCQRRPHRRCSSEPSSPTAPVTDGIRRDDLGSGELPHFEEWSTFLNGCAPAQPPPRQLSRTATVGHAGGRLRPCLWRAHLTPRSVVPSGHIPAQCGSACWQRWFPRRQPPHLTESARHPRTGLCPTSSLPSLRCNHLSHSSQPTWIHPVAHCWCQMPFGPSTPAESRITGLHTHPHGHWDLTQAQAPLLGKAASPPSLKGDKLPAIGRLSGRRGGSTSAAPSTAGTIPLATAGEPQRRKPSTCISCWMPFLRQVHSSSL